MYARTGKIGAVIHVLARLHALPEAFLYGTAYVAETSQMRGAYLNGEYSVTGWPTFFLWAFTLKSTLPFLAASAIASCGPQAAGPAMPPRQPPRP